MHSEEEILRALRLIAEAAEETEDGWVRVEIEEDAEEETEVIH